MSEDDLLQRAAAHAHAAAALAAQRAGVDTQALDTEVAAMGDAAEQALHGWHPGAGWHW